MLAAIHQNITRTQFQFSRSYSAAYAISLQNTSKNWQQLREEKLTASTFAAAVGFWPRQRVRLWREKIGAVKPFSGNLSTSWSNIKEEEALHRYKMITQHNVSSVGFRVHSKADWLAASADGMIDSSGVLEIKCPFFDGEKSRAWPWLRIPAQCVPQAQGLMEILDKEWMHFYVWTLNGSSLFKLYRDREYWGVLEEALSDFWWKHVVPGREVYGNREKTVRRTHLLLKPFRPAERHEMIERIVCESRRIVCRSELLVREVHGRMQN
ncbi:PREDICTED: uncharacterized protein LOC101315120 [Fragaria vesca subsp. vesca]|uniref:uncharacterized protein LOC101315120 n=1 Tax=Fragaria vesca subsp. vesca TaxID=101020 RepID=UPI0002C338B1|nr:PREDICTED: uncharacterized protein LOC101315120 [Fragaria vesca subsp. vesca]